MKSESCFKFSEYRISEYQKLYQKVFIPQRFIEGLLMLPTLILISFEDKI